MNAMISGLTGEEEGEKPGRRKRYGRRRPGEAREEQPDTGHNGETNGEKPASAPRRFMNALNPFPKKVTPGPSVPAAREPRDLFTIDEKCKRNSNGMWGWRRSRVQPSEPLADTYENGPDGGPPVVVLEVGPLVRDARNAKGVGYQARQQSAKTTQVLLSEAIQINHETQEAVTRTERLVNVTMAIGEKTQEQMAQQHETIVQANAAVDSIGSLRNRGIRQMIAIARNLMKDKIFMCLCMTVTLGLIAMGVIIATRKSGDVQAALTGESSSTGAPGTSSPA